MVDELNILVAPTLLGSGRALFARVPKRINLGAPTLTRLEHGAFVARYEVVAGERARA